MRLEEVALSLPQVTATWDSIACEKTQSWTSPQREGISDIDCRDSGPRASLKGGKREVRQLPFDEEIFREICAKFHLHSSISRVINRADVPMFSRSMLKMGADKEAETEGLPAIGKISLCDFS